MVSYETLYKWIWYEKTHGNKELADNLRRQGRKYAKRGAANRSRGIIKDRIGIEQRPQIVNEKSRFGDFEIDTMIGKNHKGAIMTTDDRCTRIVLIRLYFSRPYHSWERSANENTNGLVRQYIPKGTDFSTLTEEFIAEVEWKLNNRPKKSLGYLTPLE